MEGLWTIEELVEQANRVLEGEEHRAPNRRVRETMTPRQVRLYTTLGLLSRPHLRGRTGYYSQRHLMQLVAIKRLQSEGWSLVQIQQALLAKSDEELAQIARLPQDLLTGGNGKYEQTPAPRKRSAFWKVSEAPATGASPEVPKSETPPVRQWTVIPLTETAQLLLTTSVELDEQRLQEIERAAEPLRRVLRQLSRSSRGEIQEKGGQP